MRAERHGARAGPAGGHFTSAAWSPGRVGACEGAAAAGAAALWGEGLEPPACVGGECGRTLHDLHWLF